MVAVKAKGPEFEPPEPMYKSGILPWIYDPNSGDRKILGTCWPSCPAKIMSLGFSGRLSNIQQEAIVKGVSDVHARIHTHSSKTYTNGLEQNTV